MFKCLTLYISVFSTKVFFFADMLDQGKFDVKWLTRKKVGKRLKERTETERIVKEGTHVPSETTKKKKVAAFVMNKTKSSINWKLSHEYKKKKTMIL